MIRGKRGNLKSVLQQRGFGDSVRELPPADPPASMLIQVEIEAIQPYDLNPRRTENPEFFARLCESILAQGLDNPIPITRRPGEAHYRVAAGGNTRLKALQRLHEQSPNDERFAKVSCIFRPFTSEIDLITAHLRENELRDSLLFIDHAHAIVALKRRLEEDPETGGALSDAAYERWLLRMGHKVSRRDIRRMEYAVTWLDEAIPVALRRGGGPRLIDIIGNLHRYYGDFWEDLEPEVRGATAFDPLFLNVLSAHDGETLPIELIKDSLNQRVQDVTGIPANRVRAQVEALMGVAGRGERASDRAGEPGEVPEPAGPLPASDDLKGGAQIATGGEGRSGDAAATPPEPSRLPAQEAADPIGEPSERSGRSDPLPAGLGVAGESHTAPEVAGTVEGTASSNKVTEVAKETPAGSDGAWPEPDGIGERCGVETAEATVMPADQVATAGDIDAYLNPEFETGRDHLPRPADLKSWRSRAVVLATQIARAAGLQDLVQPDPEAPAGFSMADLPQPATERATLLWWLLEALSGGRGVDDAPRSEHVAVRDPAAFAWHFLFRFDAGRPPSDSLLRSIFLLIESIVVLARAAAGSNAEHS
jgi:ParB family protein of integrating conjugative element (PFGI_1 class)